MRFLIVVASVICLLYTILVEHTGQLYDCSSPKFSEFPEEIQEECIRSLQEELRDLIEEQLLEDARKKLTNV